MDSLAMDAIAYHRSLAHDWERRYRKRSFRAREVVLAECLQECNVTGSLWLDAGCGTGILSRWLAARGCQVFGVDAAVEMVSAARETATSSECSHHLQFSLIRTIAQLPAADNSMDGILCSSVLEYVPDPRVCLNEFARVLKPGGLLLVSVPNRNSLVRRAQVACHRWGSFLRTEWVRFLQYSRQQFSAVEFEQLLRQTGFSVTRKLPFGSPLPTLARRSHVWAPLLMFVAEKV